MRYKGRGQVTLTI